MIGDNYTNEEAQFDEGERDLTVEKIEFVTSPKKGTEGIKVYFLFGSHHEFKMNKTFWDGKMFNRIFSSFITAVGLNTDDLDKAAKEKRFSQWLEAKLPGRHGIFWCEKGEPNDEGKRYLQVMTKAETDYADWKKSQNGGGSAPGVPSPEPGKSGDGLDDTDVPF